jgi:hypothetical protein
VKQFIDEKGEMYMELDRYLYGLKQSPLKFQLHLKAVLVSAGYIAHSQEKCFYFKKTPDGKISIHCHLFLGRKLLNVGNVGVGYFP